MRAPGNDHFDVDIEGDVSGQVVVGHGNSVVNAAAPVDLEELRRFAQAVTQALPVLGLDDERRRTAEEATAAILGSGDRPDHGRLRTLGNTLRRIVEGAAGNALAEALLGIWTP